MSQINLNHTTPAAPGGNTNVTWQVDGSNNVSGYVPNATVPLTTKGDLLGYGSAPDRIPVGANGQVITADSAQALGVKWATPAGSAAPNFFGLYNFTAPPALSSYTQVNASGATLADGSGYVSMICPGSGSSGTVAATALVKALPSTPYGFESLFLCGLQFTDYNTMGICIRDSGSGKMVYIGAHYENAMCIDVGRLDSPTSFNGRYTLLTAAAGLFTNCFLKMHDDGTNFNFYYSADGINWIQAYQVSRTDFLTTPNQVGWFVNSQGVDSSQFAYATLVHWLQTT